MTDITDAWNVDSIGFRNKAYIVHGTDDPSISGYAAPIGTLYIRHGPYPNGGDTFQKFDVQDIDWRRFAAYDQNGQVVGVRQVVHGFIPGQSGSTVIPFDTSTPLITEGTEIWSDVITPHSTINSINITYTALIAGNSNNRDLAMAIFRDNTCIAASPFYAQSAKKLYSYGFTTIDSPNTTNQITYSVRIGSAIPGRVWYVNLSADVPNLFNTVIEKHAYIIEEVVGP